MRVKIFVRRIFFFFLAAGFTDSETLASGAILGCRLKKGDPRGQSELLAAIAMLEVCPKSAFCHRAADVQWLECSCSTLFHLNEWHNRQMNFNHNTYYVKSAAQVELVIPNWPRISSIHLCSIHLCSNIQNDTLPILFELRLIETMIFHTNIESDFSTNGLVL